jgi:hypothetical protein
MAISDPVRVFRAATNMQAHLLCGYLEQNGIETHVLEDNPTHEWLFGLLPQVHKPEVCVDRCHVDDARSLVETFELEERQRNSQIISALQSEPVAVDCEECGKKSTFPASQLGTLQECSHCGAYVDVGEPADPEAELS